MIYLPNQAAGLKPPTHKGPEFIHLDSKIPNVPNLTGPDQFAMLSRRG